MSEKKESLNKKTTEVEEKITLTTAQLQNLVGKLVDEKIKTVSNKQEDSSTSEILKELVHTLKDDGKPRARTVKEIDKEDYLESEVLFFCYTFSFSIFGDVRFGQQVSTPYNTAISFKPLHRYKRPGRSDRSSDVISVSVAKIRSKQEVEWLRGHSLFGIKFFESHSDVENIDNEFADTLANVSYEFNRMSQHEIVTRAKSEGMDITNPNPMELKRRLVYKLAERRMQNRKPLVNPVDMNWNSNKMEEVLDKNSY